MSYGNSYQAGATVAAMDAGQGAHSFQYYFLSVQKLMYAEEVSMAAESPTTFHQLPVHPPSFGTPLKVSDLSSE